VTILRSHYHVIFAAGSVSVLLPCTLYKMPPLPFWSLFRSPCPLPLLASSITSPDFLGGAGSGGYAFTTSSTGPSVLPPILPSQPDKPARTLPPPPPDDMHGWWWFAGDAFRACKSARPHTRRDFHGPPGRKLLCRFSTPYLDFNKFCFELASFFCCKARSLRQWPSIIHVLALLF
jgi:hypothetical protein